MANKDKRGTPPRKKATVRDKQKRSKRLKPGRLLEMLTARIEGAISDSDVIIKSPDHLPDLVMEGETREVDVSLRSKVGSAEVLVIIECRDRRRSADVTWLEQVKSKREAVGADRAIAVASASFSKRALAYARRYGVDARTLAQLSTAEIKAWAGALEVSSHLTFFDNVKVTAQLAGAEPLPHEIGAKFNALIKERSLDAQFIAYPDRLLSPLDVVRKIRQVPEIPKGSRIKITVPPKSSFVISENPPLMSLVGTPPEAGDLAERHAVLNFDEGEASFAIGEFSRPLVAVLLDFTVRVENKGPVDPHSYRYSSSTGVIEVAEHVGSLGGESFVLTQHRQADS
jgi:hypothetical protein